jgi:hypothetical protein
MMVATVFISCCSNDITENSADFSGTFNGKTEDDRTIKVKLMKSAHGYHGYGELDGEPIALSLFHSLRGIGKLSQDDRMVTVAVDLSFNRNELSITGLNKSALLYRHDIAHTTTTGPFAGKYVSSSLTGVIGTIDLSQNENLVSGTGIVYSQAFALSGIVNDEDIFKGRALFFDRSEAEVTAKLQNTGSTISMTGLLGELVFKRM